MHRRTACIDSPVQLSGADSASADSPGSLSQAGSGLLPASHAVQGTPDQSGLPRMKVPAGPSTTCGAWTSNTAHAASGAAEHYAGHIPAEEHRTEGWHECVVAPWLQIRVGLSPLYLPILVCGRIEHQAQYGTA